MNLELEAGENINPGDFIYCDDELKMHLARVENTGKDIFNSPDYFKKGDIAVYEIHGGNSEYLFKITDDPREG